MSNGARAAPRLSDDQLAGLLGLLSNADSAELKLTIPEAYHRSTAVALGMDPLQAQIRLVTFFDTPDLTLDAHGLVVRARRVQGRGDDSVIKLRPVVPDALPAGVRDSRNVVVEVDAMPGGYVCSATMKARLGTKDVRRALAGERSIRKLFSKEQRAFYAAHAPDGIALEDLSVLGPILVLKLNFRPAELDRKLVAEVWSYPNGSRILELSTKCRPGEAAQAAVELRAHLADRGVEISGKQQTKTRTALTYFSKQLG
jgi:hypothetical protein